jgi:hypothetical protein
MRQPHLVQQVRPPHAHIVRRLHLPVELEHPRQGREGIAPLRGPTECQALVRERAAVRVSHHARAVCKSGVADELVVPQTHRVGRSGRGRPRRKHRNRTADIAAVERERDVVLEGRRDLVRSPKCAGIEDMQGTPQVPADAAVAVAPREPRPVGELLCGVRVGPGPRDFVVDFCLPVAPALRLGQGGEQRRGRFRQVHGVCLAGQISGFLLSEL